MRLSPFSTLALVACAFGLAACGDATTSSSTPVTGECTACHGDPTRAGTALEQSAPPADAHGLTARTEVTVGAHQAHLSRGVACTTCHTVPAQGDRTHIRSPYATVVFAGNLVGAQGATVAPWDRTKATCANYCHGGFTNGNKVPVSWTSTAAMTCNSCHGATPGATASLPGGTHPQGRADCSLCHPGSTTTTVNAASHLNGQFDVITLSCTSCHGDPARAGTALEQAAPPIDASGRTARSDLTVGAHQPHLAGGVPCSTCHEIPAAGDRTHAVPPFATVIFSGNRVGANGTPVAPWDRTQATCANYCHNGFAHGGTLPTPVWNQTTSLSCGACHWDQQSALTASGLHLLHVRDLLAPATPLDCGACHGAGYSKAGVTGAATTTHADTLLEVLPLVGWEDPRCVGTGPRTCAASCHNAPPLCRNWP